MTSKVITWLAQLDMLAPARPRITDLRPRLNTASQVSARAWRRWWNNRPLRTAVLAGLAAFIALELGFNIWAHRNLEGETYRAFMFSTFFGVPERELAAGMQAVQFHGYDGQFYYFQSNDLFGRHDAREHIDNVLYRYQRIGVPMLAGGLASLLGYELTPPLLYHSVQFALTAAGFGGLVYWLLAHGLPGIYALGWLLSVGTLESLCRGILDAPGDSLFILTLLAALAGRMWFYVPLAVLMVLTREGYVIYAFAIFAMTVLSRCGWQDALSRWRMLPRMQWRDVGGYWKPIFLTAIPGIALISWIAYLSIHFQIGPGATRDNPDAVSWPYWMMCRWTRLFYVNRNWHELRLAIVSGFTLLLVSVAFLKNMRRMPLALACALPYVFLTACLGKMVWEHYVGSMKANGTIIILGLLLTAFDKSIWLRFMLALQAIIGIGIEADVHWFNPRLLSPYLLHEAVAYPALPEGSPDNLTLTDRRSSLDWVDARQVVEPRYRGVFDWFHREITPVQVAVTNQTNETWQRGKNKHPIWLGCTVYNGSGARQLCERSIIIDKTIEPGETQIFEVPLELRRRNRGYVLEFSLMQDGVWFKHTDSSLAKRYDIQVK